ncbi:MAG: VOC family protein [Actinomycetes bacterium]
MATHGIGRLWKPVVNVTDLDEGERFWSMLSGLTPTARHGDDDVAERFSSLEDPEGGDDDPWLLLQLVPHDPTRQSGGTHLDLWVDDVSEAVRRTEQIGGRVVKSAALYPNAATPSLEWAVMSDPFGNPFCFVNWPLERH